VIEGSVEESSRWLEQKMWTFCDKTGGSCYVVQSGHLDQLGAGWHTPHGRHWNTDSVKVRRSSATDV